MQAIVPIHSTLLIGSTATRIIFFWEFVDWKLVRAFLVGSIAGAFLGARIYIELPEAIIATAISIVMLVAIWLPKVPWRPRLRHPWVIVGFIHSLLSTQFAYGALLHAVILHTNLQRRQIVGTAVGKMIVDRLSETVFRLIYRVLITVTALRLLYIGLLG